MGPFSLAFLDSPYGRGLAEKTAAVLKVPEGFEELERRVFVGTEFVIMRAAGA